MRAYIVTFFVGVLLVASCSRAPSLADQITAAGGTAALIRDCQTILAERQRTTKEVWTASDTNLPPTIAALRPQFVQTLKCDGFPVVNIMFAGSAHKGLLVVLTNVPPGYVPRYSIWKTSEIASSVFEYHE
jgi:hypothetical protein